MKKSFIIVLLFISCLIVPVNALPYRIATTVFEVSASSDDAYYTGAGSFASNTNTIYIKDKTREMYVGLKFADLSRIPSNATIVSAYIRLYSIGYPDSYQALGCTIYGYDVDEVESFANSTMLLSQNKTDAYVNYNTKNLVSSTWDSSPDVKSIINEVRGRASWNSTAGIGFYIISVPTLNVYSRQFQSSDYSSGSYSPQLVVSYSIPYTTPPYKMMLIANTTWMCQNGTSLNYTFINSTETYEVYEVWNDTRDNGWIGVHDDATDHFHIYDSSLVETDLTSLGLPLSMGASVNQRATCRDLEGNTYFVATMDLANDEVVLFKINSVSSVSKVKTIKASAGVSVPYCIYKSNDNQVWVFWYNGATQQYAVYDIDDDTVTASAGVVTFTTFGSAFASEDGSHIYYVGEYSSKYGWAKYEDGVGWSAITQLLATDQTSGMVTGTTTGSTVHLYAIINDVGNDCRGLYMDSDESWGSLEAIHAGTTVSHPVQAQFADNDPETVHLYWYCTDATPDCIYHKDRLGGKTGSSFGSTTQIISEDTTGGTYGVSIMYEGAFYMSFGSGTAGKQSVMEGVTGVPVDIDSDNIRSVQPFIVGLESDHLYDIHFLNCTWLYNQTDPFLDPEYDEDTDDGDDDNTFGDDINALLNSSNLLLLIGLMGICAIPISISVSLGLIREGQYANAMGVLILGFMGAYTMIVTWLGS